MYKRSLQPLCCRTRQHILEAVWKSGSPEAQTIWPMSRHCIHFLAHEVFKVFYLNIPKTHRGKRITTAKKLSRKLPKCIKTSPKMEPKWSQKSSLDPLLTQVASLSLPGSIFEAKWVPFGSQFWHHLSNFGILIFVLFSGTPKSDILASKRYRNRLILGVIFWVFSSKAESRFLKTLT